MIIHVKHIRHFVVKVAMHLYHFCVGKSLRVMSAPETINWLFVLKVMILKCKGR